MKKSKIVFLIVLFIGCVLYTNILEHQEVMTEHVEMPNDEESMSKILLYFLNNENELVSEYRFVHLSDLLEDMPKVIINELLNGPQVSGNKSILSKDIKLISVDVRKNVVSVNFSKEFINKNETEQNRLNKIYSIVNSLTEIKEIDTVEILVEGVAYDVHSRDVCFPIRSR